jgi:PIN domain nuclease of toxin-antitoxin system
LLFGVDIIELQQYPQRLEFSVFPFTQEDALVTAQLWDVTKSLGLSFGGRACLALAKRLGIPVLTADRAWQKLKLGVTVRPVR